ncbi:MAG: tRNA lysidine(34) synthetase TilS [Tepidisphaeraceae bacterium]
MSPLSISQALREAVATAPAGGRAVGVSGGANSVALLHLLRWQRPDISLHVVHLDHETRAGQSAIDADFVRKLAGALSVPATIARRSEVEAQMAELPRNLSARFRAVRLELFRQVIAERGLAGVMLAHHADDQAETVLQRLLRGSGPAGLAGMTRHSVVAGVTIVRPLLDVRGRTLREFLIDNGLAWREDPSNRSPRQQRNRVRKVLEGHDDLVGSAIALAEACATLTTWLRRQGESAAANETLDIDQLRCLPLPVAREAARRWLADRAGAKGVTAAVEIAPAAAERLLAMAADAATASRQHFPGGLLVRRRAGKLFTDVSPARSRTRLPGSSPASAP